ncbi:MAG: ABC transporter permease, partial [Candidatus Binataceae bacterium]
MPVQLREGVALPVGVVVALIVFFAVFTDSFFTLRNLTGISGQASTLLLACLGASFVILMGSIDLSVGAIVLLVGALTVKALTFLDLGAAALVLAAALGAVLGLANGLIYA